MAGCGQTNTELVKVLLDSGANPNAMDTRGEEAGAFQATFYRDRYPYPDGPTTTAKA